MCRESVQDIDDGVLQDVVEQSGHQHKGRWRAKHVNDYVVWSIRTERIVYDLVHRQVS